MSKIATASLSPVRTTSLLTAEGRAAHPFRVRVGAAFSVIAV
jgi:hypothetical protein